MGVVTFLIARGLDICLPGAGLVVDLYEAYQAIEVRSQHCVKVGLKLLGLWLLCYHGHCVVVLHNVYLTYVTYI